MLCHVSAAAHSPCSASAPVPAMPLQTLQEQLLILGRDGHCGCLQQSSVHTVLSWMCKTLKQSLYVYLIFSAATNIPLGPKYWSGFSAWQTRGGRETVWAVVSWCAACAQAWLLITARSSAFCMACSCFPAARPNSKAGARFPGVLSLRKGHICIFFHLVVVWSCSLPCYTHSDLIWKTWHQWFAVHPWCSIPIV